MPWDTVDGLVITPSRMVFDGLALMKRARGEVMIVAGALPVTLIAIQMFANNADLALFGPDFTHPTAHGNANHSR